MEFHDVGDSSDPEHQERRLDGALLLAELLHDMHLIRRFFFKVEGDDV